MKTPTFTIDPSEFAGKRVLVSGGTKGAGEAIVRRLASAGAQVVTTARSPSADADLPARFIAADLATPEGAAEVSTRITQELGGVDILIHNLGGSHAPGGGFAALTDDLWLDELSLNLLAAVRLDEARRLLEQGSEPIEHVASRVGFGSVQVLRSHFRRTLGVSPRAYRASFRPQPPHVPRG